METTNHRKSNDYEKTVKDTMHLFLIRHGESVDNVAGVYAGSRDSALTTHGVLQARRLGAHLAGRRPRLRVTHIFSSDLQRAADTADAILDAQRRTETVDKEEQERVTAAAAAHQVVKLADLRERDFRSAEGRRFGGGGGGGGGQKRASDAAASRGGSSAFADAESHEEMRLRSERFIDAHLRPLLSDDSLCGDSSSSSSSIGCQQHAVVVVSHGLFLNVLLSSLLQRFAPSELARLSPAPAASTSTTMSSLSSARSYPGKPRTGLSVLWSNTGYAELSVDRCDGNVRLTATAVNCVEHLQGLKKTRGGIGSAQFDAKQRTMDAFFAPAAKRQKRGDGRP